ncbi:MAG TPA: hypothetical protein VMU58_03895 [Gaiellaceae bacterium]|nr:hypothetical protein [Gaiellaceae bacterium]
MARRRIAAGDVVRRVPLVPQSELGESPLWPTAAVLSAAGLYVTLPGRFIVGRQAGFFGDIRWIVMGLTVVLLAALLVSVPHGAVARTFGWHAHQVRVGRRVLSLGMIAVLTAANSASIYLLVHVLINGGTVVASPLLRAAVHLWCVNVLIFALWFWQLDGGGPVNRDTCAIHERDFFFPQQSDPVLFGTAWHPSFIDYLYVSYTNSSAFSPTDTMPLSRWAKVLMLVQSAVSLTLGLMVVARAVNILR